MAFEFIKSEKGYNMVIFNGALFHKERENSCGISWRCEMNKKFNCRKRLKTCGDELTADRGEHNHQVDYSRIELKRNFYLAGKAPNAPPEKTPLSMVRKECMPPLAKSAKFSDVVFLDDDDVKIKELTPSEERRIQQEVSELFEVPV